MAKKKTKPAANPARGFATTSVASKPVTRVEKPEPEMPLATKSKQDATKTQQPNVPPAAISISLNTNATSGNNDLTPEEFERQLEESELQILVEKHAQQVRKDAQRQKARLETDRRLLRGQAEPLNVKKWLPQELTDHILDLIQAESRFTASASPSGDTAASKRLPPEEELTMRLWTLQQTLSMANFSQSRVDSVLQYILDIAASITATTKDNIWGLEEALDWLARECDGDELRNYDQGQKNNRLGSETPLGSPLVSGTTTPLIIELKGANGKSKSKKSASPRASSPRKTTLVCNEDIEPDELVPTYLDTKTKLFQFQRPRQDKGKSISASVSGSGNDAESDLEEQKLLARLDRIENDVLFDKNTAEMKWKSDRIILERAYAAEKKKQADDEAALKAHNPEVAQPAESDDEITKEAERIAAEILQQNDSDDDQALSDLFASLPTQETDAKTGKTSTVMNGEDGVKVYIRDFGKLTGLNPTQVLQETCRSRDSGCQINYQVTTETTYATKSMVVITWSKPQELPIYQQVDSVESHWHPKQFVFSMTSIATSEKKSSQAYIATVALFSIFNAAKEENVHKKLPAVWRELWSELAEARKEEIDAADRESIKGLRALVRQRQDQEEEDGVLLSGAFRGRVSGRASGENGDDSGLDRMARSAASPEYFQQIWRNKSSTSKFQNMLKSRMQLPMWQFRDQVLNAVEQHQVIIVCGETGCGKSTQVPSFLLEHQLSQGRECKIYCTEPRRISAISLARRVSEELGEGRNDLGTSRSLIGYSIRLEANTSKETRLVYATTGIVMRMLEGSNELKEITHLVLDEVHERSIDSDFLLIVLKKLMVKRTDLKVVLMSATVDADKFSKYLGGAPVLNVPGRTFPVQVKYLEDAVELTGYSLDQQHGHEKMTDLDDDPAELEPEANSTSSSGDAAKSLRQYSSKTRNTLSQMDEYQIDFELITQLCVRIATDPAYIDYSKAILVFLPGIAEIRNLNDFLLGNPFFQKSWEVYPLHSTIATEDQERAFLVPPPGFRKIVLATNIAETGITIPDVTCVIDTGKHREMRFDEKKQLSRLLDTFISKANAKQRRGRAGRVQEGLCFHMFTKFRHDQLMSDQQTPEMLRLSLQDLAIRVKICKIGGIEETLGEALDAPSAKNIRRAVDALVDVRALSASEELTPLGHQLARLPLDVFLGKLILQGAIFKCLDMAITVAAILSSKSPFTAPFGQRTQADQARKSFKRGDSDLLTVYNAYLGWKKVCQTQSHDFQYCRKNFLSQQTLSNIEDLKGQLIVALVDSGFLKLTDEERKTLNRLRYSSRRRQFFDLPQRVNINSDNDLISASVIGWSFYPKLLLKENKGFRNVSNNQTISLHPSSVNKGNFDLKWLSYYHIMQSKQFLNAHETTAVENFAIALLCGDVRIDMYAGVIVLDGNRARFSVPDWKSMLVIKVLRSRLRELLNRCFKTPGKLLTAQHEKWLDVWQLIFSQDFSKV